jgi:hypothetical protein
MISRIGHTFVHAGATDHCFAGNKSTRASNRFMNSGDFLAVEFSPTPVLRFSVKRYYGTTSTFIERLFESAWLWCKKNISRFGRDGSDPAHRSWTFVGRT